MNIIAQVKDVPGPGAVENASLEVIGLGLPRCGTSSLHAALEGPILDYGPSLHMKRIVPSVHLQRLIIAGMRETDQTRRQKIVREFMSGYRSAIDWPVHFFVDDLMDLYPDAKLVLNLRPGPAALQAKNWAKSVHNALGYFASPLYRIAGFPFQTFRTHYTMTCLSYECLAQSHRPLVEAGQGAGFDWATEEFYTRYIDHVKTEATKRGRELLVWEPGMGWEPLCKFLGRPPPSDGLTFPHLNDASEMKSIQRAITTVGTIAWGLAAGSMYAAYRYGPALFRQGLNYWRIG